jgi:hypothetical protein
MSQCISVSAKLSINIELKFDKNGGVQIMKLVRLFLYLCAAEAEMFPGTPTVHSTYTKGPDLVVTTIRYIKNSVLQNILLAT